MQAEKKITIAVDGPAASGKGTLAKVLAKRYNLAHLDTGLLYRAVAAKIMKNSGNVEDENLAILAARRLEIQDLVAPELREEFVGRLASIIALKPAVREALLDFQRSFARFPGGPAAGAILDGRDIGSVVLPNADIKIFVTATIEVRAERRYRELRERGVSSIRAEVLHQMRERDERDRYRKVAPLVPADGAQLLDTTYLDADAAFEAACKIVAASWAGS